MLAVFAKADTLAGLGKHPVLFLNDVPPCEVVLSSPHVAEDEDIGHENQPPASETLPDIDVEEPLVTISKVRNEISEEKDTREPLKDKESPTPAKESDGHSNSIDHDEQPKFIAETQLPPEIADSDDDSGADPMLPALEPDARDQVAKFRLSMKA